MFGCKSYDMQLNCDELPANHQTLQGRWKNSLLCPSEGALWAWGRHMQVVYGFLLCKSCVCVWMLEPVTLVCEIVFLSHVKAKYMRTISSPNWKSRPARSVKALKRSFNTHSKESLKTVSITQDYLLVHSHFEWHIQFWNFIWSKPVVFQSFNMTVVDKIIASDLPSWYFSAFYHQSESDTSSELVLINTV